MTYLVISDHGDGYEYRSFSTYTKAATFIIKQIVKKENDGEEWVQLKAIVPYITQWFDGGSKYLSIYELETDNETPR